MRNTLQAPNGGTALPSTSTPPEPAAFGRFRRVSVLAMLALGIFSVGVRAQCQASDTTAELLPTKAAVDLNGGGQAGFQMAADCSQILGVNALADVPDGEELTFVMTTATSTTILGTAPAFESLAQFVMLTAASAKLPTGAIPFGEITHIQVYRNPNGATAAKRPAIRPKPLQLILDAAF